MATEEETSLAVLIQTLNGAILASISELVPALENNPQASQLRQESQRLQIWSNDLGIEKGDLVERLRGEKELQYSIVTLHIMIAQGLITAEKCVRERIRDPSISETFNDGPHTPLEQAVARLEKQYPQFTDNFSATTISSLSPSIIRGDGATSVASDVSQNDIVDELDESLADVSTTIDRLLRLSPFLEQYLHESDDDDNDGQIAGVPISRPVRKETNIYCDSILTRFPQASHHHVRIIADSRQRLHSVEARGEQQRLLKATGSDRQFSSASSSDPDVVHLVSTFEEAILEDKEVPYPALPQDEHGYSVCNICSKRFSSNLSLREWRLHVLDDYQPFICLEMDCSHPITSFNRLQEWSDHSNQPHPDKLQWTCKLCGSRKFAAKSQLQYHTESIHYIPAEAALGLCELWQEKVAAKEEETECVFCNEPYGNERRARVAHLGRHMIEIALLTPLETSNQAGASANNITATISSQDLPLLQKLSSAERIPEPPPNTPGAIKVSLDEPSEESNSDKSMKDSDSDGEFEVGKPHLRVVIQADFILEEIDSDFSCNGGLGVVQSDDIEVVQPDEIEEVIEESPIQPPKDTKNFLDRFKELHYSDSSDEEERERVYRRKKKRWSAGIFKRSHSQSVEGDSSYSDNDPLEDVDSSARRLRRRVRGTADRGSLIFEDQGYPNSNYIVEIEEPDGEGFTLHELPFWDCEIIDEGMEMNST